MLNCCVPIHFHSVRKSVAKITIFETFKSFEGVSVNILSSFVFQIFQTISDINLWQSENFSINLMVYHPRPPQSMLRTFLPNPVGMKIFLAQNTTYKWHWIGFFLDPLYKESIQHWLWGAGKNNFWQNLNVYLNENVFDDLIFIYRMKIHFAKDILSLIVWKF